MAPIGEAYFPPLDRCFSRQQQLLSWKATYVALSQLDHSADNVSLKRHLADPQTIDILAHAFSPFQPPNPQTKSTFETKTSAINVASSHAPYDIKQIREDTLWLSNRTNIDEVSALRIAVLEWQARPVVQLMRGAPEREFTYLNGDGDTSGFRASSFDPGSSLLAKSTNQQKETFAPFEESGPRRRRLLEVYLSERRCILKCTEFLTFIPLSQSDARATSGDGQREDIAIWLREAGANILSSWSIGGAAQANRKHTFVEAIETLRSKHESLSKGCGWLQDEDLQEDIEVAWARSQILEMIHIMQIMLHILESSTDLLETFIILPWFRLMRDYEFYDNMQLPPTLQMTFGVPLVSLPALISLATLKLPSALELLEQSATTGSSAAPPGVHGPYILHAATVNEINDIIIAAACLQPASPAVMAWAILMNNLRDIALSTRDSREVRQSLRAADRYGAADSSDTDVAERSSTSKAVSTLRRQSSIGSDTSQQSTLLEEIHDIVAIAVVDGGDPIAYLANNAAGTGSVFEVVTAIAVEYCTSFGYEHDGKPGQRLRKVLLDLIRVSAGFVEYAPPMLTATLAVLTGSERYWEASDRSAEVSRNEPAAAFFQDKVLTHKLYITSMLHFPYETLPFVELCRALAFANDGSDNERPAIWTILEDADNFTCALPSKDYQGYESINMQDEASFIALTQDLDVAISPALEGSAGYSALAKSNRSSVYHRIPSGTSGRVMNDAKPHIVAWNQSYSPLMYMGKVLLVASAAGDMNGVASSLMSAANIGGIIGLLTNMVSAATKINLEKQVPTAADESAQLILGVASEGMGRNQDVVSVIFDIFEKELYKPRRPSEDTESLELLTQCVQFTFALLLVVPDRVWPFLGRSGLLGLGKEESRLNFVVATQEMIIGQYTFLLGCIRLFDSLVTDAVEHMVSRKTPTKALTRFDSVVSVGAGISQTMMEKVLFNLTRVMIETFESSMKWKFLRPQDRMEINFRLCSIFQKILECHFGVGGSPNISKKLTAVLAPTAEYIVDVFLSRSNTDVILAPIMHILTEGTTTRITTLPLQGSQYITAQVRAVLEFSNTLIRVNRLLQRPTSHLEHHMFTAVHTLAVIYATHEMYKTSVVGLFDTLIRSAADTSEQPPSLFGHLGHEASTRFLDLLSMFDQPLIDDGLSIAIWKLLSTVVSKRQQWFAVFVLTGTSPKESFKAKPEADVPSARQSEPILNVALDALSNIDKLNSRKALSMLEFVALAADFWPWVMGTLEKHSRFLRGISEYAAQIGSTTASTPGAPYKADADYNSLQLASLVVDILSMYTHYTQQMGNHKFAKNLVPHLTYLIKNAISTPSYNSSLHGNLRRNLEQKYLGCQLVDFKRTNLTKASLGESFFYDLEFADAMLSYDPAWAGRKGNDGFAGELRRANFNLSVVESQINLFHSWRSLLIELSVPLIVETKFQKIMATATIDCLKSNAENKLPEAIFVRLTLSRANLAFTLLQRLLEIKSAQAEVLRILPVAWDTVRTYNANIGSALDGDGADYYRTLLKILYLSLQLHAASEPSSDHDETQTNGTKSSGIPRLIIDVALEIISTIVAQGFRSLTIILRDNPNLIHPSDFALLTAILRSALRIPDVTRNTTHLLSAFSDSQTARCASSLLSWSDQLTTSGDPIYGELSILFLLEMSSVPALAESLAVEGVLPHILTTNLVRLLQNRDFGPFSQPVRMHSIWVRGILPLLLNLLDAVGPPLAVDIAAALNSFPHQLDRASSVFTSTSSTSTTDPGRNHITLSTTSEAVTLSLIITILQTFREAGPSVGITSSAVEEIKWDRTQVKEEAEDWLQRRDTLRDKIMATNEREEGWSRAKPEQEGEGAMNKLEEKVVEEMRTVVGILGGNSE